MHVHNDHFSAEVVFMAGGFWLPGLSQAANFISPDGGCTVPVAPLPTAQHDSAIAYINGYVYVCTLRNCWRFVAGENRYRFYKTQFRPKSFGGKLPASNFGQRSTQKQQRKFYLGILDNNPLILKYLKATEGHNYKLKFDQNRFCP
jgi:hypothetical protein